jgi:Na+/H+-dicarboxylate symporter
MTSIFSLWSRSDLTIRILVGLGLGILTGLFFGEPAAVLQPLADIYIRLMQMTVLPSLVTSLVIAFGQLDAAQARRLAMRGGALLALTWLCAGLVITTLPLAFPEIQSASFYSQALIEPQREVSFTELYFTANPFDSLSRNVVPAVVIFSCMLGIALIGIEGRERLLAPLRVWNAAIVRIALFIVQLTPIGVFAIGAATAGTLQPETLQRLEIYLAVFAVGALLLAFLILPLLVTAMTPFGYREVTGIARDALLTAFVANSAFIVLPILIERCKALLARRDMLDRDTDSAIEALIPVMFNFPNAGKLLTLLFIPFAAWMGGAPLPGGDYMQLLAVGIPSYFAKAQTALPYLLDLLGLPRDLFELYIPTTIITGKFDSMVTAMNLVVIALLGAAAAGGFLVIRYARLLRAVALIAAVMALVVVTTRLTLSTVFDTSYDLEQKVRQMHEVSREADIIVLSQQPAPAADGGLTPLQRIEQRGTLRVGFDPQNLPMSFFNDSGELVGFEVELAEKLAAALALTAEFVPVSWPEVPGLLERGIIDVMPGVWYRPFWFSSVRLSDPYLIGTVALAVRDERRHEFTRVEALRRARGLRIGVPLDASQIRDSMQYYFGDSGASFEVIEHWQPYFEGKHPGVDAFLLPAEHASGWSLLYPHYTVVVPQPEPVRIPSAFGVAPDAGELLQLVNEWVIYADNAAIIQRAYDYWVLGQGAKSVGPRWSIARDVLGWMD